MGFLRLMFGFRGRATRMQFWLAALVWAVAVPGAYLLAGALMAGLDLRPNYGLVVALVAPVLVPVLVSFAAVGSRRLHDRGKSGLWMLVFFLIPYFAAPFLVGFLSMKGDPSDAELMVWFAAAQLPSLWGVVELGFLPGTPGPNRFGDGLPATAAMATPA